MITSKHINKTVLFYFLKNQLILITVITAILLLISCEKQSDGTNLNMPSVVSLELNEGDTLTASQGVVYILTNKGFGIKLTELVEDSRCPENATCIWEGNAAVRIDILTTNGSVNDSATLNTNNQYNNVFTFNDTQLKLVNLLPYPNTNKNVDTEKEIQALFILSDSSDVKKDIKTSTGIVKDYTGLDGCGFVIEGTGNNKFEPILNDNIDFTFEDGQHVKFSYTQQNDMASICMVGQIIQIEEITEINSSGCDSIIPLDFVYDSTLTSDPYEINSIKVNDNNCLEVVVSYSGGCAEHFFDLYIYPMFCGTPPLPNLDLVLTHDNNNDMCEAYPTDTLHFDLNSLGNHWKDFPGITVRNPDGSESETIRF